MLSVSQSLGCCSGIIPIPPNHPAASPPPRVISSSLTPGEKQNKKTKKKSSNSFGFLSNSLCDERHLNSEVLPAGTPWARGESDAGSESSGHLSYNPAPRFSFRISLETEESTARGALEVVCSGRKMCVSRASLDYCELNPSRPPGIPARHPADTGNLFQRGSHSPNRQNSPKHCEMTVRSEL